MIEYSTYHLTPLKRINSQRSIESFKGMLLRRKMQDGSYGYADYFPHESFGDLSLEQILTGRRSEYFKKCLWFLNNEKRLRNTRPRPFLNHRLAKVGEEATGHVKVKLMGAQDFEPLKAMLKQDARFRLDANGAVELDEWSRFLSSLGKDELNKIDYIEDPGSGDWRKLSAPTAKDFMKSEHFDFEVYKANSRFCEDANTAIFSSYMGSDLGRYHCFLELMDRGNLDLVHGVHTPGLYHEQRELFKQQNQKIALNEKAVAEIYAELEGREWSCLS